MKLRLKLLTLVITLVLGFAVSSFADYRTVEVESLRITVDSEWASQGTPGYLPIRLDITNLGDNREIRIVGSGQRYFDFYRRSRPSPSAFGGPTQLGDFGLSQTVRLKRGDRVKLTLAVPV